MVGYEIPHEPPLEPSDYDTPRCPICGEETYLIFIDKFGDVVGCEECVTARDAYEWQEENKDEY